MKGLELSEQYYREYGIRMIQTKFLPYQGRIAAGLVGDGSDCYGFDDEVSQDHDWGPGFCLWLTQEDHEKIANVLQFEYDMLPSRFGGYQRMTSQFGGGRVGVSEIGAFYKRYIGMSRAPNTVMEWLHLPETYLAICTNGKVFNDPLGDFTRIRGHLLAFYPEDVRLWKMAERCMSCAQSGQYNYMRSVRRGEYFAAQYAETQFCADILSLVFLLNRRYAPFYKWRHRGVRELPILGQFLYKMIGDMVAADDCNEKYRIIEEISAAVIHELHRQELSESNSDFLLDHGPRIRERIQSTLRNSEKEQ